MRPKKECWRRMRDEHSEEKKRKWSTRRKMRILQELSRSAR
jgi:hypothetical protein